MGAHPKGKKTEYAGHLYDSPDEAKFAQVLAARQGAGEIFGWCPHPKALPLVVNGHLIATWHPDFAYLKTVASPLTYVEVKGRWKPESKLKMKLFAALYPNLGLEVVGTPMDRRTKAARAAKSARIAARLAASAARATKRSATTATKSGPSSRASRKTVSGSSG